MTIPARIRPSGPVSGSGHFVRDGESVDAGHASRTEASRRPVPVNTVSSNAGPTSFSVFGKFVDSCSGTMAFGGPSQGSGQQTTAFFGLAGSEPAYQRDELPDGFRIETRSGYRWLICHLSTLLGHPLGYVKWLRPDRVNGVGQAPIILWSIDCEVSVRELRQYRVRRNFDAPLFWFRS